MNNGLQLIDQVDIEELAQLLMKINGISQGRDIVWLFNDGRSTNNQAAIQNWLRAEVWTRLTNQQSIELKSLVDALRERLNDAMEELRS